MQRDRGPRLAIVATLTLVMTCSDISAQSPSMTGTSSMRATLALTAPTPAAGSTTAQSPASARDNLRDLAKGWIASQTGVDMTLVTIGALDARVAPPECETGYRFDFPFESRTTIRANCERPVRQFYMRVSIERVRQRLVLSRAMSAGEVVSFGDLTAREIASAANGFDNPSQVVGRALRRSIPAGEAPLASDLEEVVSVLRALRDMRTGEAVPATAFRIEQVPRSRAPSAALMRSDDLSRARLRRDIPAEQILVADDLTDTRQVLIAKRNLMRGETLESAMLEIVEMDRRSVPPDYLSNAQGLEQGEVTGMVRAGEPLRASMVRPALMVRKGQSVILNVARAGIEINVQVEALEDARFGDQVKLRNPESGKGLAGVVTGRGSARAL